MPAPITGAIPFVQAIRVNAMFAMSSRPVALTLEFQSAEDRSRFRDLVGFPEDRSAAFGAAAFHSSEDERRWFYIDNADQQQGPFPRHLLQQWVAAGYFRAHTLVRPEPVTVDEQQSGVFNMFLPISTLFPVAAAAFANGNAQWKEHYMQAHRYQVRTTRHAACVRSVRLARWLTSALRCCVGNDARHWLARLL